MGRKRTDKSTDTNRTEVLLDRETMEKLLELGDGDLSRGIRRAVKMAGFLMLTD